MDEARGVGIDRIMFNNTWCPAGSKSGDVAASMPQSRHTPPKLGERLRWVSFTRSEDVSLLKAIHMTADFLILNHGHEPRMLGVQPQVQTQRLNTREGEEDFAGRGVVGG